MSLPTEILSLLSKQSLCFLATSTNNQPHLSLMNFTYSDKDKLIIMSTRKNTQKHANVVKNPSVAILVHNTHDLAPGEKPVSCTIYGRAMVEIGDKEELYRIMHYERHKGMRQFIHGDDIAIISVSLNSATIADNQDNVTNWPGF